MQVSYYKHILSFKTPVKTSRGELQTHTAYLVTLKNDNKFSYGEASPLVGLSIDDRPDFEFNLANFCRDLEQGVPISDLPLNEFPSIQFAFETALTSLHQQQTMQSPLLPLKNGFGIPINGLVWMDTVDKMYESALEKIQQGFTCIKFKIGAFDFDTECRMVERIRKKYNAFKLEIRLDANGAFVGNEALEKIIELSRFGIHSLEQPIKAGQHDLMQEICHKSTIPIALDEELIGVNPETQGNQLLAFIRPQFLILKPTLLGGLKKADAWIRLASQKEIRWWATSALESNIGLNYIAQWCAGYKPEIAQGLGTGELYTNNISGPLYVKEGKLLYDLNKSWQLPSENKSRNE